MYQIDYNSYRAIKSFNRRVHFLVMHYTALDFKKSVVALTGEKVSVHYLIPDPSEKTYIEAGFKDMRIFNLVDENERAWHAGVSAWAGRNHLNDTSIGIEIVHFATNEVAALKDASIHKKKEEVHADVGLKEERLVHDRALHLAADAFSAYDGIFSPYNPRQIDAVKELSLNILQRYPDIMPTCVVGHSDIAVGRKSDPGPTFPWKELYMAGIGAWYEDERKAYYQGLFCKYFPPKEDVLAKLQCYGYDISAAGDEIGYKNLIRAFQLHFRQENYDGTLDVETAAILYALVDKYFPSSLV